jgi:methylmalonyl-CoA mutase cobalamin-binding subunit
LSIGFSSLRGQHQAEVGKIQSRLQAFGRSELGEFGGIFPLEPLAKR